MPAENVTPEPLTMSAERERNTRELLKCTEGLTAHELLAELDATRAAHADMVRRFDNLLAEARSEDAKLSATIVDLEAKLAEAQANYDTEFARHMRAADALTAAQADKASVTRLLEVAESTIAQLGDKLSAAQATIKAQGEALDACKEYADAALRFPDPVLLGAPPYQQWRTAHNRVVAVGTARAALASRPSDAPTTESGK